MVQFHSSYPISRRYFTLGASCFPNIFGWIAKCYIKKVFGKDKCFWEETNYTGRHVWELRLNLPIFLVHLCAKWPTIANYKMVPKYVNIPTVRQWDDAGWLRLLPGIDFLSGIICLPYHRLPCAMAVCSIWSIYIPCKT